jgi:hypothetical protein
MLERSWIDDVEGLPMRCFHKLLQEWSVVFSVTRIGHTYFAIDEKPRFNLLWNAHLDTSFAV